MAKITAYPELTAVASDDMLVIVDDVAGTPTTKKISRANLVAGLADSAHAHAIADVTGLQAALDAKEAVTTKLVLAADVSTGANTTPVSLTGLSFAFVANGKYVFDLYMLIQSAAATTGAGFQVDTSVAVTAVGMTFMHQLANTGTLSGGSSIADDASTGVSSGVPTLNTNVPVMGRGLLIAGANAGTAQFRYRSETTAVTTCKANSTIVVTRIA
jgi:hypothetical protein